MEQAEQELDLDEQDYKDLAVRVADLIWFDNAAYAKSYLDRVRETYKRDSAEFGRQATRAVIWNLAKVMLIKDEVFVAHLLTSEEKIQRDRERYEVDESRGDRMSYSHINRPRFDIGSFKIEFDIRTYNWQLNIMKRMKFLRKLLPQWHRPEKEFRDWYTSLLGRFYFTDEREYSEWLEILRCPEPVTGYRHIRHPKQEAAKRHAEAILARLSPPMVTSSGAVLTS
jgi:indolepyruvate ferredoxin oxidoreductase